jgi:hypothetical protein
MSSVLLLLVTLSTAGSSYNFTASDLWCSLKLCQIDTIILKELEPCFDCCEIQWPNSTAFKPRKYIFPLFEFPQSMLS